MSCSFSRPGRRRIVKVAQLAGVLAAVTLCAVAALLIAIRI
jgi:hypothetical protein